jgi:hypothetical protein
MSKLVELKMSLLEALSIYEKSYAETVMLLVTTDSISSALQMSGTQEN